ncbi:MAG: hypothetical protein KAG99_03770 [Bacteroidales bacterium]|nr:hypothetical protein [Bacteroidales bacterium]
MKKALLITLIVSVAAISSFGQSQTEIAFNSTIKSLTGEIIADQTVMIRIGIFEPCEEGERMIYCEMHFSVTDNSGKISLGVGDGIPEQGDFSSINWQESAHFIKACTKNQVNDGDDFIATNQCLCISMEKSPEIDNMWNKGSDCNVLSTPGMIALLPPEVDNNRGMPALFAAFEKP